MSKVKRVLVMIPNLAGGGAEKVIVTLLGHLNRERVEPILLVTNLEGPFAGCIPGDIQVINLQKKRIRYALLPLIKEVNRLRPDTILSTIGYMNLAVLLVRKFFAVKPKIIVRQTNTLSKSLQSFAWWKRMILRGLYRWLYPQADIILTQSDGMRHDILSLLQGVPAQKVVRIFNPLDIDYVTNEAEAFNPYEQVKEDKIIVAVGRMIYVKGFDLLLNAFRQVHEVNPSTRLYLLGEGPLQAELHQLAVSLGIERNVTFMGFQSNPYPYMKYADLLVLPSRTEGFPNVLTEALACGVKIVAADCRSGPREILGNSEFGLLVAENEVQALADGMMACLSLARHEAAGMERAQSFHARKIAEAYEGVF
jgi:glycosyltransferase involved in cell wall biosynthesis